MPRPPRLLLSHSYYHIMARGNNRHTIFESEDDYEYYLKLVKRFKKELPFNLYHFCLMPNHIHLLAQTKKAENFSLFMKKINLAYFHHYNKRYGWVGHFWQDRFKSQPVGKDEYFVQCGKYIELNPLRAGLIENIEDWNYSSYKFYAFGEPDKLLTPDPFFHDLAKKEERQKTYQELLISDMVNESYGAKVWGSGGQVHNEEEKVRYHLRNKVAV